MTKPRVAAAMTGRLASGPRLEGGDRYEIVLARQLGPRSARRFSELELVRIPGDGMLLRGVFADQAALHGVLARIRDLGVPLVSVRRVDRT